MSVQFRTTASPSATAPYAVRPASRSALARASDAAAFGYAVFAFAACTSAFQLAGLSTAAFGVFYLGGSVVLVASAHRLIVRPVTLLPTLLFPAVALCSTVWSVDPEATLRHAVQLTFTALVGACIGTMLSPHRLFAAMCTAFAGLVAVSVANLWLRVVPAFQQKDYLEDAEYFTGIFVHKNTLGLVLCLAALCLVYMSVARRPRWAFGLAALALLPVLLFARSTTSIALYGCILCMPLAWALLRLALPKALIVTLCLCAALGMGIVVELLPFSIVDAALGVAGKGRDLSGRTELWDIAVAQVFDAPWLGVGYQSYWSSPRFADEVSLVRGMLEPSIGHFHSVWLETLVGTGIWGLVAFAAVPTLLCAYCLTRLWAGRGTPLDIAAVFMVGTLLARATVEASMYYQHRAENLVLIALLVSLAGAHATARATDRPRPAPATRY